MAVKKLLTEVLCFPYYIGVTALRFVLVLTFLWLLLLLGWVLMQALGALLFLAAAVAAVIFAGVYHKRKTSDILDDVDLL